MKGVYKALIPCESFFSEKCEISAKYSTWNEFIVVPLIWFSKLSVLIFSYDAQSLKIIVSHKLRFPIILE
jgi:hypothetical protein